MERADVAVVGAGIIGLASAHAILRSRPGLKVLVVEKELRPAVHQSGRNSGVIHSGIYYRPGSLKARMATNGRLALLEFCRTHCIPHEIGGKVIVATDESERPGLDELARRGRANGVAVELVGRDRLAELEPHAQGVAALHVPGAGVVDFAQVCEALARLLGADGGELRPGQRVRELREIDERVVVVTEKQEIEARVVVNCGGLYSDRLAAGPDGRGASTLRIVPFRGEYCRLAEHRADLVRSMIYPVPDPRFPFLGVHFTRGIDGEVHAGPNAVLALAREGYSWRVVDLTEILELLRFPGFRRLLARHWRTGLGEISRSLSKTSFVNALRRLVPAVEARDLIPAGAGVRAQAVDSTGALVDDFVLQESPRVVHVLNAPSPAATASLEIGRAVAERALQRL